MKKILEDIFIKVISRKVQDIKSGIGSFLGISFELDKNENIETSEWYLWITYCGWRLEKSEEEILSSDSEHEEIDKEITLLKNKILKKATFEESDFSLFLEFTEGYSLRTYHEEYEPPEEYWNFFIPNDMVFVAGPDNKWKFGNAEEI